MSHSVVLLSSEYPPRIFGGLGTHVAALTAAMAQSVEFHILVPDASEYVGSSESIHIHPVPTSGARNNLEFWLQFCQSSVRIASRIQTRASLIHCHDWMTVLAGTKLRELMAAPLVYNVHLPQNSGPTLHFENFGIAGSDRILVNSSAVARELSSRDLTSEQIVTIPNGVDSALFHRSPTWPQDQGYILFVGRLVPQKGLDVLLKAFGALLRRCPDIRLVIVGDGYMELFFKRVARYLGIASKVSFVGWTTGPSLIKWYQDARFVVIPSHYEPFGIVALEAMACARPVIAARVGGLEEIVVDPDSGFLFPAGDHLELAKCMARLVLDPERCEQMGRAAIHQAARFDWKRLGDQTLAIYNELIGTGLTPKPPAMIALLKDRLVNSLEERLRPLARELLA